MTTNPEPGTPRPPLADDAHGLTPGPAVRWAAGVVESGPGSVSVHLVFRTGDAGWETACPADSAGRGAAGGPKVRHVRPTPAGVNCPDCMAPDNWDLVAEVNREAAEQQQREAAARELVAGFLRWASEEYPADAGGAVLAVYAGSIRLHAMRPDERDRAVDLWLEGSRRYPGGA